MRDAVTYALHEMSPIGTRPVWNRIDEALVQFRMHRTKEAYASLDSALSLLDVTRGRLMTSDERDGIRRGIDELRHCINTSTAPPLATLTVHTLPGASALRTAAGRLQKPVRLCASTSGQWDAPVWGAFSGVQRHPGPCE